jgi:hypothetical protein
MGQPKRLEVAGLQNLILLNFFDSQFAFWASVFRKFNKDKSFGRGNGT